MNLHIPPALLHRKFRLLWIGLSLSVIGSRMQFWALLWHIRDLTEHPIALGGIGAARIVPIIIFSLIGGTVADMANRRRVLFITQAGMGLTALILALLTYTEQITLWHIYTLTALQAIAISFDLPARQALVPNLVPARDLPNAFSIQSIASQVGSIFGPAISGLVLAYWGLSAAYFINTISYLAMFIVLIQMGDIPQARASERPAVVGIPAIKEGIAFILNRPIILSTMLLDFFATFFSSANALMPIFARDILHVSEVGYGWLSAAQSIGATITGLVISQLDQMRRQGPVLLVAVIFFGLSTVLFGATTSFAVAMIGLMGMGAADTVSMIIRNTIRQLRTPDHIRGRMVSVNQIFFMGGPQLGEIEAGLVAQFFGAPFAVISGGVACILSVGWVARRWPQLRTYDTEEAVD